MTCIVGLEHDGCVWMGGDSAATDDTEDRILLQPPKVFEVGEFLIGHCGDIRGQQALEYGMQAPTYRGSPGHELGFLCTEFIDSVKRALDRCGVMRTKDGSQVGELFLLGHKGKLYTVEPGFAVVRGSLPFAAVGCGAKYAMGAMSVMNVSHDPKLHIEVALGTVAKLNSGVFAPFTIICGARP